jgi:hypothetical protein
MLITMLKALCHHKTVMIGYPMGNPIHSMVARAHSGTRTIFSARASIRVRARPRITITLHSMTNGTAKTLP